MTSRRHQVRHQEQASTLLGINPMSKNCVDAALEIVNENDVSLMLIASRRQIEAQRFGGGYVNNWTTEEFAQYVRSRDKFGRILIGRDHGGPWQADFEKNMSLSEAMASAKNSMRLDIESGFRFIHIDPSAGQGARSSIEDVSDRIFELYEFCLQVSSLHNNALIVEIGAEEQTSGFQNIDQLETVLSRMARNCSKKSLPYPKFVVAQTGTLVKKMRNVGQLPRLIARGRADLAAQKLQEVILLTRKFGILLKEHNGDYLSNECLEMHPRIGIDAMNIGPQLGVTESLELLSLLNQNGLGDLAEEFLKISLASKKWQKWLLPSESTSFLEKSLVAGHYVFSLPEVLKLKEEAKKRLIEKGIDLEHALKSAVKKQIVRHLVLLGTLRDRSREELRTLGKTHD